MKKIIKTLLPIASITTLAGCIVPITSCNKGSIDPSTIAGIVITSKPTKTSYAKGEYLDLTGLEVKLVKKDGKISLTDNYTVSMEDKTRLNEEGKHTIKVTCKDTPVSDSFEIEVGAAKVCKLEVTTEPKEWKYDMNAKLDLTGLVVKATKTDDQVDNDFKDYLTYPANGEPLTEWGRNSIIIGAEDAITTTDVFVTTAAVKWSEATWEMIADWTYFREVKTLTNKEFYEHFLDDLGNPFTSMDQFVGKTKTVDINNKAHTVKVIAVDHDEIDDNLVKAGTKATFTFQFANVLCNSNGKPLKSTYNDNNVGDYINSQLRYNLNKTGSATKSINWFDSTEKRSLFEMLPEEFENYVWPVKRKVATKPAGQTVSVKDYTDKLFVLSANEYNLVDTTKYFTEGTPYTYWQDSGNSKVMNDLESTPVACVHFTVTPTQNVDNIYCINTDGQTGTFMISNVGQAIAPCFCI